MDPPLQQLRPSIRQRVLIDDAQIVVLERFLADAIGVAGEAHVNEGVLQLLWDAANAMQEQHLSTVILRVAVARGIKGIVQDGHPLRWSQRRSRKRVFLLPVDVVHTTDLLHGIDFYPMKAEVELLGCIAVWYHRMDVYTLLMQEVHMHHRSMLHRFCAGTFTLGMRRLVDVGGDVSLVQSLLHKWVMIVTTMLCHDKYLADSLLEHCLKDTWLTQTCLSILLLIHRHIPEMTGELGMKLDRMCALEHWREEGQCQQRLAKVSHALHLMFHAGPYIIGGQFLIGEHVVSIDAVSV